MRSFLTGIIVSAAGLAATMHGAVAGPLGSSITVGNAGFESLSSGTAPDGLCFPGGPNGCAVLSSWVNTDGYAFVSSGADLGNNSFGDVKLSYVTSSPVGGNFVALDGNNIDGVGTISQMLSGLTIGDTYAVTFYQAAAEQTNFSGAISEQWQVGLGGSTKTAAIMNYNGGNWVGWEQETVDFSATSTSELLSFLSIGLPGNGAPPFALLDGVSVQDVPEPAAFGMLGFGALGLMVLARRRGQAQSGPAI
jgi:hypothetical protein